MRRIMTASNVGRYGRVERASTAGGMLRIRLRSALPTAPAWRAVA
jgi:hypothetical protein